MSLRLKVIGDLLMNDAIVDVLVAEGCIVSGMEGVAHRALLDASGPGVVAGIVLVADHEDDLVSVARAGLFGKAVTLSAEVAS